MYSNLFIVWLSDTTYTQSVVFFLLLFSKILVIPTNPIVSAINNARPVNPQIYQSTFASSSLSMARPAFL